MHKINFPILATLVFGLLQAAPVAAHGDEHMYEEQEPTATVAATELSSGTIKKVDAENGKLTIKHGPIANLGMPGMTMVFKLKDQAQLGALKAGDEILFSVEKQGSALVITELKAAVQ